MPLHILGLHSPGAGDLVADRHHCTFAIVSPRFDCIYATIDKLESGDWKVVSWKDGCFWKGVDPCYFGVKYKLVNKKTLKEKTIII